MEGAEITPTCTADIQYATILTDNMVGSGVYINAIGGNCPVTERWRISFQTRQKADNRS